MPKFPDPDAPRTREAFRVIEGEGIDDIPELPELTFEGEVVVWHPEVRAAWERFWESPLRREFIELDLTGMVVAMTHLQDFYANGVQGAAREFRTWAVEYGATPNARRRMRVTVKPEAVKEKRDMVEKAKRERPDPRAG